MKKDKDGGKSMNVCEGKEKDISSLPAIDSNSVEMDQTVVKFEGSYMNKIVYVCMCMYAVLTIKIMPILLGIKTIIVVII